MNIRLTHAQLKHLGQVSTHAPVYAKRSDPWVSAKPCYSVRECELTCETAGRMTFFAMGFYFPLFYIQLDALTHGLNETFSFYSVPSPSLPPATDADR